MCKQISTSLFCFLGLGIVRPKLFQNQSFTQSFETNSPTVWVKFINLPQHNLFFLDKQKQVPNPTTWTNSFVWHFSLQFGVSKSCGSLTSSSPVIFVGRPVSRNLRLWIILGPVGWWISKKWRIHGCLFPKDPFVCPKSPGLPQTIPIKRMKFGTLNPLRSGRDLDP